MYVVFYTCYNALTWLNHIWVFVYVIYLPVFHSKTKHLQLLGENEVEEKLSTLHCLGVGLGEI